LAFRAGPSTWARFLERAQEHRRTRPDRIGLAVEEVRVTGVQQPPVAGVDRDGGVPPRCAGERDEQDLRRQAAEVADRLEAEPPLAAGPAVRRPGRIVCPLVGPVPPALAPRRRVHRGLVLAGVDVHGRPREVADPADVVEVEVGQHDVPDLLRPVPEPGDLADRGLVGVEPRVGEPDEPLPSEPAGSRRSARAQPAVDEDEPVAGLDQQAVADHRAALEQPAGAVDQPPAGRPHGGAVEVVDAHAKTVPRALPKSAPGH
jgi:hypothetical protein